MPANKIPLDKYYENIKIKTGNSPSDFKKLAISKGYFEKGKLKSTIKICGSNCLAKKRV